MNEMSNTTYVGGELELFEKAYKWKGYYGSFIKPYLKGRVLEVGAGIGGTTAALCDGSQQQWVCLEPDADLSKNIEILIDEKELPGCCKVVTGTLEHIAAEETFNAIIYIDVIEHIEKDKKELENAARYLMPGGVLIVLVPAHQWLYTAFDKAIGHYRRYNKSMLLSVAPQNLKLQSIKYLDSIGVSASLVNKLFLKSSMPSIKQIAFWNKFIVPISKWIDPLTGYSVGKSLLGIWQRRNNE